MTLKNNKFDLNPHNEWTKEETSDRTSLKVYNGQHIKVLDVKYFNEAAVRIMGVFQYGKFYININEDRILMPIGTWRHYCAIGTHNDICVSSPEHPCK